PRRRAAATGAAARRSRARGGPGAREARERRVRVEGAGRGRRAGASQARGGGARGGRADRPARGAGNLRFREALADLDARQPESMPAPSIERISRICEMLDHPELTYPSIHITGTNGKTTTAHMASGLACAHGLPTGMFVSPHVVSVTERISVCGRSIANDEFAEEYAHLLPYLDAGADSGQRVTYFEALTALGYLWFADKPVSLAVFEVGMGGTWDATNLIRGDVAMICPIGL